MGILKLHNIKKQYDGHIVLNDISMIVPKGSIYGLLGPNGAGKTSLIRMIMQIIGPDSGRIFFNDESLAPRHSSMMGYLPEERGLYKKMTVSEQLIYLAQLKGLSKGDAKQKISYWISKFEMDGWEQKKVEDLSKGMQQKVQFVASVMHDPQLVILDEPFTGFDPVNANILKEEILNLKSKGVTIIFSTHRMESVEELCDEISLIHHAKIILQGNKHNIKQSFKTATYRLVTDYEVGIHPNFEIIKSKKSSSFEYEWEIKVLQGTGNDLIKIIAERAMILHFSEKIPDMNDIFIDLIQKKPIQ